MTTISTYFKILGGIITLVVTSAANADGEYCAEILKHNLAQRLQRYNPYVSSATLHTQLCSLPATKKDSVLGDVVELKPAELKAAKNILCKRSISEKKTTTQQRVLKKVIGASILSDYKRCLQLEKHGVALAMRADAAANQVALTLDLSKNSVQVQTLSMAPKNAFTCEGSLIEKDSQKTATVNTLFSTCTRNAALKGVAAQIVVQTSAGAATFDFAASAVDTDLDFENRVRMTIPQLPSIPGCTTLSVADRTLRCTELTGYQQCRAQVMAGNLLDCRAAYSPTIYPNVREVLRRADEGTYDYAKRGALGVTVYRGNAAGGRIAGEVQYSVNFDTPTLAQRSNAICDVDCPLFDSGRPCNRDCVFADHVLRLPSHFGVASLTREAGNSCEAPLTGAVRLEEFDKYRAYNLCEARNAWGRTTTGIAYAEVSKFYYFNDFRTTHSVVTERRNGREVRDEIWEVINQGERVRAIAELEIPITIACNG
jgi:hypothetical protein